jgi:nicotinate-nucleotide adenylyltransferase
VFGGTFNPIHFGHLNSIETVTEVLGFDELWVVPTNQNPLRAEVQGPSAEHRVEIVRAGLASLSNNIEKYKVRDDEIRRGGVSYTVHTLEDFCKERKDVDFSLIIGADQFTQFDKWKDYLKILKIADLVVTSRPGVELPTTKLDLPAWLQAQVKTFRLPKSALKSGRTLTFVKLNDIDVSATEIRRKVRRNENVSNLTPALVVDYLKANKIYDPSDVLVSDYNQFTKFCANVVTEKGGLTVSAYDLRKFVQPAEYTLVASGTSTRHTKALAEHITKEAKEQYGIYPQSIEGMQEGRWIVIDYGSLMVHIFYDFVRGEYRIEDLWAQAPRVNL